VTPAPVVAVDPGEFGEAAVAGIAALLSSSGTDVVTVGGGTEPPAVADVLVTLPTDRASLTTTLSPGIRWVHALAAGVDGFPFDLVGDRVLTCSRGASAPAIAEFVLAAMLAFEKDLPAQWLSQPPARWNTARLGGLAGRTLGLVGLGAIGTETARRALAFDMSVTAVRRTTAPSPLPGVTIAPVLDGLLAEADHVIVVAPATPATRHLIDRRALAACKRGVHLVNVSRGSLVDQSALIDALDDGRVAMASLDVVEPEPLPAGHPLYRHPRVHLSAHVSWSSPESGRRTLACFADNLARYRVGEPLLGVVDVDAGY